LQEKLAALIGELADDDAKTRMRAYRDIEALGKDVAVFLQGYKDHENLEIRASVRELIKKLQ
jgi:hypothetical protein